MGVNETTTRVRDCFAQLMELTDYEKLVGEVEQFNGTHKWTKKGVSIQSMKYGHDIGLSTGSPVTVTIAKYDGSVQVVLGGCEMGQGIHTRCAQVVARNLGCSLDNVFVKMVSTEGAPNAFVTGGTFTTHVQMLLLDRYIYSTVTNF